MHRYASLLAIIFALY